MLAEEVGAGPGVGCWRGIFRVGLPGEMAFEGADDVCGRRILVEGGSWLLAASDVFREDAEGAFFVNVCVTQG